MSRREQYRARRYGTQQTVQFSQAPESSSSVESVAPVQPTSDPYAAQRSTYQARLVEIKAEEASIQAQILALQDKRQNLKQGVDYQNSQGFRQIKNRLEQQSRALYGQKDRLRTERLSTQQAIVRSTTRGESDALTRKYQAQDRSQAARNEKARIEAEKQAFIAGKPVQAGEKFISRTTPTGISTSYATLRSGGGRSVIVSQGKNQRARGAFEAVQSQGPVSLGVIESVRRRPQTEVRAIINPVTGNVEFGRSGATFGVTDGGQTRYARAAEVSVYGRSLRTPPLVGGYSSQGAPPITQQRIRYKDTPFTPAVRRTGSYLAAIGQSFFEDADEKSFGGRVIRAQRSIPLVGKMSEAGARGIFQLGVRLETDARKTEASTAAAFFGGRGAKKGADLTTSILGKRFGVTTARRFENVLNVGGATALVGGTALFPEETIRSAPEIAAFGFGYVGAKSRFDPRPRLEVFREPKRVSFGQTKAGSGDGFFTVRGTGRAYVRERAYGQVVVRRPQVTYDIESISPSIIQRYQSTVPVRVRTSGGYEGVLGKSRSFRSDYRGVFLPSRRGTSVMALTSGKGRERVTFQSLISQPLVSVRGGKSMQTSTGYRSQIYQGSRFPALTRVLEGTVMQRSMQTSRYDVFVPYRVNTGSRGVISVQGKIPTFRRRPLELQEGEGMSAIVRSDSRQGVRVIDTGATEAFPALQGIGRYKEPLSARTSRSVSAYSRALEEAFFPRQTKRLYSGLMFEKPQIVRPKTRGRLPELGGQQSVFAPPLAGIPLRPPSVVSGSRLALFPLISRRGRAQGTGSSLASRSGLSMIGAADQGFITRYFAPSKSATTSAQRQGQSSSLFSTSALTGGSPGQTPGFGSGVFFSTPPPVFPRLPFSPGGVGGVGGGYGLAGAGARRKYRYSPDLFSVAFGIRGKKGTRRRGTFLGLEARPI